MRPAQKIFGKRLKAAREALYLTQRQLGDKVGLSSERIGSIEQKEISGVDRERVPQFAAALKMTEAEFIQKLAVTDPRPAAPILTSIQISLPPDMLAKARQLFGDDAEISDAASAILVKLLENAVAVEDGVEIEHLNGAIEQRRGGKWVKIRPARPAKRIRRGAHSR